MINIIRDRNGIIIVTCKDITFTELLKAYKEFLKK